MKKQLLLSTVLAAALAAGSAYAAGSGSGAQSTEAQMDRTQAMERDQSSQLGGSTGAQQGYDSSRVGVGGVSADQTAQITNNTDAVRNIQQALQEQGADIQVDGIWGPNTQQALRDFQQQQGQTQATGEPDQETLQALDVEISGMQPQTAETPSEPTTSPGMGTSPSLGTTSPGMESSPGMGSPTGTTGGTTGGSQ